MNSLVYWIKPCGRLKISEESTGEMTKYRQRSGDEPEAGGLLLGRNLLDCDDIVVDYVTVPMPQDNRKRYFFNKNRDNHQQLLEKRWRESKGTCNYIGEWHTHPECIPNPSSHDLSQWRKILRETITDVDAIFFAIMGTEAIRIWQGNRKTKKIFEITPE